MSEYKENADILVVKTEKNELAAAVLFFTYKDQMVPYYAGSDFTLRQLGPNDFLYWELMKLAVEKKCTIFDFGRSKEGTGSFSFKKHWGFLPQPLAYQYYLAKAKDIPNLSPANPKYQKKNQNLAKYAPLCDKIFRSAYFQSPCMKKNILFLCHRIPYPPNKGDKIRSFNEIKFLSQKKHY